MAANGLVLVTGATGYLGGHIVYQLLEAGYRVRGTVRTPKLGPAKEAYSSYGDRWEVTPFDDVAAGDLTEALRGVEYVIHTASPLAGRMSAADTVHSAVEGALNTLRQTEKAGIKRFVFISSLAAAVDKEIASREYTDQDWNETTKEEALDPANKNPFNIYYATKALAEKAVWEFADSHPHIDVTTVLPPFFYGPFAPGYTNPEAKIAGLSTNGFIYGCLLTPKGYPPPTQLSIGCWIDVRDVARSVVLALAAPPSTAPGIGRKRIFVSGEWFNFGDAAEYLAEVRPELKGRLSQRIKEYPPVGPTRVSNVRATEVLGIDNFKTWKESILESVDNLLALEKEWTSKGLKAN